MSRRSRQRPATVKNDLHCYVQTRARFEPSRLAMCLVGWESTHNLLGNHSGPGSKIIGDSLSGSVVAMCGGLFRFKAIRNGSQEKTLLIADNSVKYVEEIDPGIRKDTQI